MNHQQQNQLLLQLLRQWQQELLVAQSLSPTLDELLTALQKTLLHESATTLLTRIRLGHAPKTDPQKSLEPQAAEQGLQVIRQQRRLTHQKKSYPTRNKLDRYRQEILTLQQVGASQHEIRLWLLRERRCRVTQPTVSRYLKGLQHEASSPPSP